jgi:hypothetical protein
MKSVEKFAISMLALPYVRTCTTRAQNLCKVDPVEHARVVLDMSSLISIADWIDQTLCNVLYCIEW